METSLPAAQIDLSQPCASSEKEGNRNEENEEALSSDLTAIAGNEGEELEPESNKGAESQATDFPLLKDINGGSL